MKCQGPTARTDVWAVPPTTHFMLGLQVHPTFISPFLLLRNERKRTLELSILKKIDVLEGQGLKTLAGLIFSTSREVSEQ